MNNCISPRIVFWAASAVIFLCPFARAAQPVFQSQWEKDHDRTWAGAEYWTNPMEDWRIQNGRLECISEQPDRNVHVLTCEIGEAPKAFNLSVRIDRLTPDRNQGCAGFRIGARDQIDDYRAAALRGKGLDCGVTAKGTLFFGTPADTTWTPPAAALSRAGWKVHFTDSTQGGEEGPGSALDGNPETFWHSKYQHPPYPHEFQVDLGRVSEIHGFAYLPRQNSESGHIKEFAFFVSKDGKEWGRPAKTGIFKNDAKLQTFKIPVARGRYIRLQALSDYLNRPAAAIAEFLVLGPGDTTAKSVPSERAAQASSWRLDLNAKPVSPGTVQLNLSLVDNETGHVVDSLSRKALPADQLSGNIALFHNTRSSLKKNAQAARFAFHDLILDGPGITRKPERAFGPILWAMHSLSNARSEEGHVLKMTAQMPPLGEHDSRKVLLQVQENNAWKTLDKAPIHPDSRTATFRRPNWPADKDIPYRLVYTMRDRDGQTTEHFYTGTVRKDPIDRPLILAGFTGNTDYVFPNCEIARNVGLQDPDVLFFSGDQLYEHVGGYGIIRNPPDRSTLNYLRKWYLLGWAFGDLMRDRVTLCIPDDHDVYQGNIWGENGRDCGGMAGHASGGYAQPIQMVNAVHLTQTSHHPDPYDPTPIERGITVYYGDMVYGGVSFAVIADRMFKSGPQGKINTWKGRPDHVKTPTIDIGALDKPDLKLLGDRQLSFLEAWAQDWRGAYMKIVLSQTIFCNLANYHGGNQEFIIADLDSNGWPQSGRRHALEAMRRGFAFHLAGDQHLASIVWHGTEVHRDAGWSFCVPSIAAGYPRSWRPDREGRPVENRPEPRLPNTGDYLDGLGNRISVFAVGNPAAKNRPGSVNTAHDKASGYGILRMDQQAQTITMECWRLQFDANDPKPEDQFPGWPRTVSLFDNYGRKAKAWLPTLQVRGLSDPFVQVVDEADGKVVYTVRKKGTSFRPKVFKPGTYTVRIGNPDEGVIKVLKGLPALPPDDRDTLEVVF